MDRKATKKIPGQFPTAKVDHQARDKNTGAGPHPIGPPSKQAEKRKSGPPPNWTTKQAAEKNRTWTKIQASNLT